MRVIMQMKWDGVTPDQYDHMRKSVNLDADTPKGLVFHSAGFKDGAAHATDVWETADDFNAFVQDHLMAAAAEAGISGQPQVEIFPVHAIWTPLVAVSA